MQNSHNIELIIGLANPGERYAQTRHNAGSWFIDSLLETYPASLKNEAKFFGHAAQVTIASQAVRLLVPSTYMNESGKAAQAIMQFYKIAAENILVAYDDIDLPPGIVRLKHGGGSGGHNGLRSLAQHLGTEKFNRLRIGVGHPGNSAAVADYVLAMPSLADKITITQAIDKSVLVLPDVVNGHFSKAMNVLHTNEENLK